MSTEKFVERFLTSYDLGRTVVKRTRPKQCKQDFKGQLKRLSCFGR